MDPVDPSSETGGQAPHHTMPMEIEEAPPPANPPTKDPLLSHIEATSLLDGNAGDFGMAFHPSDTADFNAALAEAMNPPPPPTEAPYTFLLPAATYGTPRQTTEDEVPGPPSPSISRNQTGDNYASFPPTQSGVQPYAYLPPNSPYAGAVEPMDTTGGRPTDPAAITRVPDHSVADPDSSEKLDLSNASFPWLNPNSSGDQPTMATFVTADVGRSSDADIRFFTQKCPPPHADIEPSKKGDLPEQPLPTAAIPPKPAPNLKPPPAPVADGMPPPKGKPVSEGKKKPKKQKTDIKSIVLGSPAKGPGSAPESGVADEAANKKKRSRYRGKPREGGTRKHHGVSLFAKMGRDLLWNKQELAQFLPADECRFLGKMFWIFTKEQLNAVLNGKDDDYPQTDSQVDPEVLKPSAALDQLTLYVAMSYFADPDQMRDESKNGEQFFTGEHAGVAIPGEPPTVMTVAEARDSKEPLDAEQANGSVSPVKDANLGNETKVANDDRPTKGDSVVPPAHVSAGETEIGSAAENLGIKLEEDPNRAVDQTSQETHAQPSPSHDQSVVPSVSRERLEAARAKMNEWREALTKPPKKECPMEELFPLSGPVNVLFPGTALNFLKSVQIETLWKYFSAKKNENSSLVALTDDWRILCGLEKEVSYYAISKFYAGITTRIEKALNTVPCVAPNTRLWMSDCINSMTGAAREFLIMVQGIKSVEEFIAVKTKDLSLELQKWRVTKGMEPLKGSGKVAMISAWKTQCKEIMEVASHNGRVNEKVRDQMKEKPVDFEVLDLPVQKASSSAEQPRKKKQKKASSSVKTEAGSNPKKEFLSQTLGSDVATILSSVGVTTTREFLNLKDTETLFQAMVRGEVIKDVSSGQQKFDEWKQKLKSGLGGTVKAKEKSSPQTKANDTSAKKRPASRSRSTTAGLDPYETLSAQTKQFLRSANVFSAEDFLSARSSDLADRFKEWRIANGKPELRGLGAIASVSGWKSIVRKRASDMGLTELSILEPSSKGSRSTSVIVTAQRSKLAKKSESDSFLRQNRPPDVTDGVGDLLETDGRRVFAVQSQASNAQFLFELSRRGTVNDNDENLYICYKGLKPLGAASEHLKKVDLAFGGGNLGTTIRPCWILPDVPLDMSGAESGEVDGNTAFSVDTRGGGLVDLTRYGCRPMRDQNVGVLKKQIMAYVNDGAALDQGCLENSENKSENIILQKVGFDKFQYFLYIKNPIERGQTISLDFPSVNSVLSSSKYSNSNFEIMHKIEECLRVLSGKDQKDISAWLCDHVSQTLEYDKARDAGDDSVESYRMACGRRCRLHWIASRLESAIGEKKTLDGTKKYARPAVPKTSVNKQEDWNKLSEKQQLCCVSVTEEQLMREISFAVDFDKAYGAEQRQKWCKRARDLADHMVHTIATSFVVNGANNPFQSVKTVLDSAIKALEGADQNNVDEFSFVLSTGFTVSRLTKQFRNKYEEALDLCSEVSYDVPTPPSLTVVACMKDKNSESNKAVMLLPTEVKAGAASLSAAWYSKLFWEITASAIKAFECCLSKSEQDEWKLQELISQIKGSRADLADAAIPGPLTYKQVLPVPTSQRGSEIQSYPFFLGIMWPALRKRGWRLVAGSTPSEILFSGPSGKKRSFQYKKRQKDRKRMLVEDAAKQTSLGVAHKRTKRLFATAVEESRAKPNDSLPKQEHVVRALLAKFKDWIVERMASSYGVSADFTEPKVRALLDAIERCFSALVPVFGETTNASTPERSSPADTQSNGCFAQFLFSMTHVLASADLQKKDVGDAMLFLKEMIEFAADHQHELFEDDALPPREEYKEQRNTTSFLEQKLKALEPERQVNSTDKDEEGAIELVRDEDKGNITDFIVIVLEQAVPFRATEEDVRKKNGRVRYGAPGIVCKHCMGANHEGRYFFSTVESLTACYTVLEKHSLKCKATPDDVKQRLVVARSKHQEQRKALKSGLQQKFFSNLWRRMRGSRLGGADPPSPQIPPDTTESPSASKQPGKFVGEDFTDHLTVLDRIRSEATIDRDIEVAMGRYYACLEYAGRVQYTPSMPPHFSPEWLLAKVAPKNYHKNPRKRFVG